jgi:GAF domain-containing protein
LELQAAEEALARERSIPTLLKATCRQLVELLGASACAISRLVGDLIVDVAEHSPSDQNLSLGYGYLVSEYPLTQEVVERREPRTVYLHDPAPDQREAAILVEMGFDSLLMVPLEAGAEVWALVEIYDNGRRFTDEDAELARGLLVRAGELVDAFERPTPS